MSWLGYIFSLFLKMDKSKAIPDGYTQLLFEAEPSRREIPNGYILTYEEAQMLREYLESKNLPADRYILHHETKIR